MRKKWITKYYQVETEKAKNLSKERLRIAFVSDLHNVCFGDKNNLLAEAIRLESPDLILIGGDSVIGKPEHDMRHALEFFEAMQGDIPVYAANGNHEYRLRIYPDTYGQMYQEYRHGIEQNGIHLLENETAEVKIDGMELTLYGYELPRAYYHRFYRGSLPMKEVERVFPKEETSSYRIFLAHHPKYLKTYAQWGADLVLSGHYHGGIMRLWNDLPVVGNDFQLFPKYGYGRYEEQKTTMIVSAGIGEHTVPLRIHNPRELVIVDIVTGE